MAITSIGVNDAVAVKKYSATLSYDQRAESYFASRFSMDGREARSPIMRLTETEGGTGDKINYDLLTRKKQQPVEGKNKLAGNEDKISFFSDTLYIEQMRGGTNTGTPMDQQRTIHNLRDIARRLESEWWAAAYDQLCFMYGAGARGVNSDEDFIFPTTYTGFAGNAFEAPDSGHLIYSGSAVSKASLAATDKMTLNVIDKAVTTATMMPAQGSPKMSPVRVDGEDYWVSVISPWDEYNLRAATGENSWSGLQRSLATAVGNKAPIFKGGAGMHNKTVIHTHSNVIRFSDYGAGANVGASRSLFMGTQALVVAFGTKNRKQTFDWYEEMDDRGNEFVVATSTVWGVKKCRFNSKDFGIIAIDSAAAAP